MLPGSGLDSPPKVFLPIQMAPVSFDQVLSNKLHSTLVIRPPASKKVSNEAMIQRPAISSKSLDPSSSKPIILKSQLAVAPSIINDKDEVNPVISPQQDSFIIRGTKEKKHILSAYQEKYGSNYPDSIISRKKVSSPMMDCPIIVIECNLVLTSGIG